MVLSRLDGPLDTTTIGRLSLFCPNTDIHPLNLSLTGLST